MRLELTPRAGKHIGTLSEDLTHAMFVSTRHTLDIDKAIDGDLVR